MSSLLHPGTSRRRPAAVVVLTLVVLTGCGSGPAPAASPAPALSPSTPEEPAGPAHGAPPGDAQRALRVLRDWDARRAQALRDAEPSALRALYPSGSPLAQQDLALLESYRRRGARVIALETQVRSARLRDATAGRLRLRVTERLVRVRVTGNGGRPHDLGATRYESRTLTFVRGDSGWQLSSVAAS